MRRRFYKPGSAVHQSNRTSRTAEITRILAVCPTLTANLLVKGGLSQG
jgi:hypothetical protein